MNAAFATEGGARGGRGASGARFGGGPPEGYLAYQDAVETSRVFLRETTAVPDEAVLLFGGALAVDHAASYVTVATGLTAPATSAGAGAAARGRLRFRRGAGDGGAVQTSAEGVGRGVGARGGGSVRAGGDVGGVRERKARAGRAADAPPGVRRTKRGGGVTGEENTSGGGCSVPNGEAPESRNRSSHHTRGCSTVEARISNGRRRRRDVRKI